MIDLQYEKAVEMWWSIVGGKKMDHTVSRGVRTYRIQNDELSVRYKSNSTPAIELSEEHVTIVNGEVRHGRRLVTHNIDSSTPIKLLSTLLKQFRYCWALDCRDEYIRDFHSVIMGWLSRRVDTDLIHVEKTCSKLSFAVHFQTKDVVDGVVELKRQPGDYCFKTITTAIHATINGQEYEEQLDSCYELKEFLYVHFHPDFASIISSRSPCAASI
jgi:uncharacterized protein YhdP